MIMYTSKGTWFHFVTLKHELCYLEWFAVPVCVMKLNVENAIQFLECIFHMGLYNVPSNLSLKHTFVRSYKISPYFII